MEESINDPSTFKKRTLLCVLVVLTIIGLDQWLKIWVKTHMGYGDEFKIMGLDWARIHFVENDGMAFGISYTGSSSQRKIGDSWCAFHSSWQEL